MTWNRKKPYLAEILLSKLLSSKVSNKEVIHYEISLGDSGISYEPGDSLGVVPVNDHNLIGAVLDRLDIAPSTIPSGYNSSIFELLETNFEILTPTNRLIKFINDNIDNKELNDVILSGDRNLLTNFKYGKDILDFMNIDKNLKIDVNLFFKSFKTTSA